jgi:hypothetical protein
MLPIVAPAAPLLSTLKMPLNRLGVGLTQWSWNARDHLLSTRKTDLLMSSASPLWPKPWSVSM